MSDKLIRIKKARDSFQQNNCDKIGCDDCNFTSIVPTSKSFYGDVKNWCKLNDFNDLVLEEEYKSKKILGL